MAGKKTKRAKKKSSKKDNDSITLSKKNFITIIVIALLAALVYFTYQGFVSKNSTSIKVEITEITASCDECFNISTISEGLKNQPGVSLKSKRTIDYSSKEGKKLLERYKIERVPALIITSKKINELPSKEIFNIKENIGIFDKSVPYLDLTSNKIIGLVKIKELESTCDICPPASQVKIQLEKIGIKVSESEKIAELSENGQKIIKENDLKFTPAILVSKEIEEYWWIFPQIKGAFIEKEHDYVFKSPVPPYKSLVDDEIKGKVKATYLLNETCTDCFNPAVLKNSFEELGVYISEEINTSISSLRGRNLINKHNITKIPTVIFSRDIQEYAPLKETLDNLGTISPIDQSFILRNLDIMNVKYQEISL